MNKYHKWLEEAESTGKLGHTSKSILKLQADAYDEGCEKKELMASTRTKKDMYRRSKGKCAYCEKNNKIITIIRLPGGFTFGMCLDCSALQLKVGGTIPQPKNRPQPSVVAPKLL